jgi:hypothetical protein
MAGMLLSLAWLTQAGAAPLPSGQAAPGPRFALCDAYCALVDRNGDVVTPRVFEAIHSFDGPAGLYEHRGRQGAIDRSGRTLVKPEHDSLWLTPDGQGLLAGDELPANTAAAATAYITTLYDMRGRLLLRRQSSADRGGWWHGHPYYRDCPSAQAPGTTCPWVFTDAQGHEQARYAWLDDSGTSTLFPASIDAVHYGYIDSALRFAIPPAFTQARAFSDGLAPVSTAKGIGLIDPQGRIVIPPGRYASLFPFPDALFIQAFAPGQHYCGDYVRRDGSTVALPAGICPDTRTSNTRKFGYAYVHGAQGTGIIDYAGHMLIEPIHAALDGLGADYLAYASEPGPSALKGLLDRRGRILLTPRYTSIDTGPGNTFIAATRDGKGLIDPQGHWLVPPLYSDGKRMSDGLAAFAVKNGDGSSGPYAIFRPDGSRLPYASRYSPQEQSPAGAARAFVIYGKNDAQGLIAPDGRVLVPLQARTQEISYLGEGLWQARVSQGNGQTQDRLYSGGQLQKALLPYSGLSPFKDGTATARTRDGLAVLVKRDGTLLAQFSTLFPHYADRGTHPIVERSLDRCFKEDPAAEPGEGLAPSAANRRICASPALARLSRATEKRYFNAQTGPCLPADYMALRPAYERSLDRCRNGTCIERAMHAFQSRIARTQARCQPESTALKASGRPIAGPLRQALFKQIEAEKDSGLEVPDDAQDPGETLGYTRLELGKRQGILVTAPATASNGPFWLFLETPGNRWQVVLQNYSGYLRPIEAAGRLRHGLPVLRTQQHVSCCEHAVDYYAFDGRRYQPFMSCTQLYDQDDAVLFCDDRQKPDANASGAQ